MVDLEKLNDQTAWSDRESTDRYGIEHATYPIEIVVERTGSNADENENWETWLNVNDESFESEIPPLLVTETFEFREQAVSFARELAYEGGIEQRL